MLPSVFPELAVRGTLVLVHREELVNQAVEKLSFVNPRLTIGVEKAELHADISSDVVVASVQTLGSASGKRLRKLLASMEFGIVIIDEAHHVTAGSQYDRILNELGLGSLINESDQIRSGQQRLLVGVTATPNRHDNVGLSTFFNEILLNYGLQEAVQNGYLTDIRHIKVHTSANLEGLKNYRGDFSITDLSEATNTPERNQEIVSAYLKHGDSKSAVAFCSSVAHAYDLRDMFRLAGVSAEAIDGNTPKDQRKEILRRHESGELSIVTNFGVLTEGYDGMIHIVLMCRPTKSASLYMQMIGRGVRTIPSDLGNIPTKAGRLKAIEASVKPDCIVLDFVDNRHDVVTTPSLFGLPVNFDLRALVYAESR
jgi:superfamily II DNA or RNA helicase